MVGPVGATDVVAAVAEDEEPVVDVVMVEA